MGADVLRGHVRGAGGCVRGIRECNGSHRRQYYRKSAFFIAFMLKFKIRFEIFNVAVFYCINRFYQLSHFLSVGWGSL